MLLKQKTPVNNIRSISSAVTCAVEMFLDACFILIDFFNIIFDCFYIFRDEEPQTELGKKLREHLDEILAKIKEAIEHGKTVKEGTLEKVRKIPLHIECGDWSFNTCARKFTEKKNAV